LIHTTFEHIELESPWEFGGNYIPTWT